MARGAETPYLAALLVQHFGRGLAEAVTTIFDDNRAADPIGLVMDEVTDKLDPAWREHDKQRWAARPAGIVPID